MRNAGRGQSLYRELLVRTLFFLVVPFLIAISFLFSRIIEDGKKNYELNLDMMENQVRSTRQAHVDAVLQMGNRIAINETLKGFLMVPYSPGSLQYYSSVIFNILSPKGGGESRYTPKVFFVNETIPRGYGCFYRLEDLDSGIMKDFLDSEEESRWVMPSERGEGTSVFLSFERNYTYMRKVSAGGRLIYVLTIAVPEEDMDAFLAQGAHILSSGSLEWTASQDRLIVNCSKTPLREILKGMTIEEYMESEQARSGYVIRHIGQEGFPQQVLLIFSANYQELWMRIIIFLAVLLVLVLIGTVFRYMKFIFSRIHGCMEGFEASLDHGFDRKLEVHGDNEISQIEKAFNTQIDKIQGLLELTRRQVALMKDSQLMALQHQINPHFLYNTLETFSYRMEVQKHYEEADALVAFSRMMRYNIIQNNGYATINQELEQVSNYLSIQRLKRQELLFEERIEADLYEYEILRFLFQPLIENSVQHGYYGRLLHIIMTCRRKQDYLHFEIYDDGCGMPAKQVEELNRTLQARRGSGSIGIGLSNINERLCLFYSEECRLYVESSEGQWTRIRFCIPYGNQGKEGHTDREKGDGEKAGDDETVNSGGG